MQGRVELDALAGAGEHLDGAGLRVAAVEQARHAAQLEGLHDARFRIRGRRDRSPSPSCRRSRRAPPRRPSRRRSRCRCPALAPSSERSPIETTLGSAARQGAHDRGATADVGAVADDDALRDPALDHRGAERARVEVDEALVHHRRAGGEVGAEAHARGVGDPHPVGHDVVEQPRELVDAERRDAVALQRGPQPLRRKSGCTGPAVVQPTIGRWPNRPSRLIVFGRRAGGSAGAVAGRRPASRPAGRRGRSRP